MSSFDWKKNIEDSIKDRLIIIAKNFYGPFIGNEIFFQLFFNS